MRTTRRFYIDKFLFDYEFLLKGQILDIGGTKVYPRGRYRFPENLRNSIKVLNNNPNTKPDYLLSIEKKNNINQKFDVLIFNEVLEYIDDIDKAFSNISNFSKEDSIVFVSWPWMNTFHGDKQYDFKRYSDVYIINKFKDIGFNKFVIESNGGLFSVIWDFIHRINNNNKQILFRKIINIFLFASFDLVLNLDKFFDTSTHLTTGFTLIASKNK